MAKETCYVCSGIALHETIVSHVYLCDDEACWIAATRDQFIDGHNEFNQTEEQQTETQNDIDDPSKPWNYRK